MVSGIKVDTRQPNENVLTISMHHKDRAGMARDYLLIESSLLASQLNVAA